MSRRDRVLLLGQAPSRDSDPMRPLIGGTGSGRLLQRLTGTTIRQYARLYERRNLLKTWPGASNGKGDLFPLAEAREAAAGLLPSLAGRRVVLLGRGVATAFGLPGDTPFFRWFAVGGASFAVCPHPSAVNLWWNDWSNRAQATRFFVSITTDPQRAPT